MSGVLYLSLTERRLEAQGRHYFTFNYSLCG